MKNLFCALLLLPALAMAQPTFTISGSLSSLTPGPAKAYLAMVQNGAYRDVDSVDVVNGTFRFTGKVDATVPGIVAVRRGNRNDAASKRDYVAFFVENSRITISGRDSVKTAQITGSKSEDENRQLEATIRPLTNTIIRLNDQFGKKPKDDPARAAASDSVTRLVAQIKQLRRDFVESHLGSPFGLYAFNIYILDSKFDPLDVEPLYNRFTAALKATDLGQQTLEKINIGKRRQAGARATDFTQTDLNGKPFMLSSLRGSYVLVDFWASWCVPCRAENPNVVKAYTQLKKEGKAFQIVSVSLDQGKAAWAEAVKKDGMPWIHVSDLKGWKNDVATLYGITSVPQNILVNPEGMIVAKNLRGENLLDQLKAFIK